MTALFCLQVVLYLVFAGVQLRLVAATSDGVVTGGSGEALDLLRSTATAEMWTAVLYLPVSLALLITTGVWVARAHANASALAPGSQRFGRGLAAWSVVIPLGSLVLFPMTVADLWRGSDPGRQPGTRRRPVGMVATWTTCWVASLVIFFGGNLVRAGRHSDAGLFLAQEVPLVILALVSVVLYLRTVHRISGWQAGRSIAPAAHATS